MIRMIGITGGLAAFALGGATASAQSFFWTGGGMSDAFTDGANWSTGVAPSSGSTLVFNHDIATGPFATSLQLNTSVTAGSLDVEAGAATGDTILISASPIAVFTLTLGAGGILVNQTSNTAASDATITVPVVLAASQTWKNAGSDLEISSSISESSPGTSLTLQGTGSLNNFLFNSGSSTYSGGTTITGGAGTVVTLGAGTTGPGGSPTSGPLGTGTITLGNDVSIITASTTTFTLANNIVLGNAAGANVGIIEGGSGGEIVLTGVLSNPAGGTGALLAVSLGGVELEGDNTYSGGTSFEFTNGTVGNDHALGTGPLVAVDATVTFTTSHPVLNTVSLSMATLDFAASSVVTLNDLQDDTTTTGNAINLGLSTALDLRVDASTVYYGTINGSNASVSVSTAGTGVIDLQGANTYSGGTTIGSKVLVIADNATALGSGTVSLGGGGAALGIGSGVTIQNVITSFTNGSVLEGYGTLAPGSSDFLNIAHGSVIVGGKGDLPLGGFASAAVPGKLTLGPSVTNLLLGNQGVMQFSIMNATGTAGADFSAISAPSTLVNVTAIPATPFTIQLVSVSPTTGQTGLANFNTSLSYSWTLLSAQSISGFSSNAFTIDDTTDFQNALGGGTFSISESGGDLLMLNFTPVPEPSTWALLAAGVAALGLGTRRRRRA